MVASARPLDAVVGMSQPSRRLRWRTLAAADRTTAHDTVACEKHEVDWRLAGSLLGVRIDTEATPEPCWGCAAEASPNRS